MSAKIVKHVFTSLLEISKVYDLVGQPSYVLPRQIGIEVTVLL